MNKIATFFRETMVGRFFILLGVVLIVMGIIIAIINNKNKNYIQIESTVSNVEIYEEAYTDTEGNYVDATYKVNVKYTVDEKEYVSELTGLSKYNVGDKMTIYYNPDDPSQITQSKSMILPIAMIAAGVASIAGGIVSTVKAVKRHNKMVMQEEKWENGK